MNRTIDFHRHGVEHGVSAAGDLANAGNATVVRGLGGSYYRRGTWGGGRQTTWWEEGAGRAGVNEQGRGVERGSPPYSFEASSSDS